MDSIFLDGITLSTRIGVPDAERKTPQEIRVHVELFLDTRKAAAQDDVGYSIDYDRVISRIKDLETIERKTLEKLAEDIATVLMTEFPVQRCRVSVWKRTVPGVRQAAVTIQRP